MKTVFLIIILMSLSEIGFAQVETYKDSLITLKKSYSTSDKISFGVQLDPKTDNEKKSFRMVETMSCACGNKDFYYTVYLVQDSSRTAVIKHFETDLTVKCACKSLFAILENKQIYSIGEMKLPGNYQIEIEGNGFTMSSNVFAVSGE